MPIDEVGESSLPAKGVYGSLLFDENGKGNATFFTEQLEGDGAKQRAELRVT